MSNIKRLIDLGFIITDQQKLPYHNSNHLNDMVNALEKMKEFKCLDEKDKDIFMLAIAFHDSVVYHTDIPDLNEKASISLFEHCANSDEYYLEDLNMRLDVRDLIYATCHNDDFYLTEHQLIMNDLDMINLSMDYQYFRENTRKIIFEKQRYMSFNEAKKEVTQFFLSCLYNFKYRFLPEKYTIKAIDNINQYLSI